MRSYLTLLKEPSFRRFFLASFISCFGSGLHVIAITWYVLDRTGTSTSVAMVWICQVASGPLVLASLGALIDRMSRQRLLGVLSLCRGAVVLAVPALMLVGLFSPWQLYLMTFANGIGNNLSSPAERAWIQEASRKETLLPANAGIEIVVQVGAFLSAGLAGFLYRWIGLQGVLLIDAATFFIAASIFGRLPASGRESLASREQPYLDAVRAGWQYLMRNRAVLLLALVTLIPAAATVASNVVLPAYARQAIGEGIVAYGALDMFYGIGALLSGLVAVSLLHYARTKIVVGLILLSAGLLLTFPSITIFWFALVLDFVFGLCNSSLRIVLSTTLMEVVPKEFMGRIVSVSFLSSNMLQLVSFAAVGWALDHLSLRAGYGYLAGLMLVTLVGYAIALRRQGCAEQKPALRVTPGIA